MGVVPVIPVFVTVRDRVTCLKVLIDRLETLDDVGPIVLLDNASTYAPLLEYLAETPHEVVTLPNLGNRALWIADVHPELRRGRFVLTDPDVIPDCPDDALAVLGRVLDRHPELVKVGLGLRIDDLPSEAEAVRAWESQFWLNALEPGVYDAGVDTTFALYRPDGGSAITPAARTGPPYVARHLPWYQTDPEETYYRAHATPGISHWTGSTPNW